MIPHRGPELVEQLLRSADPGPEGFAAVEVQPLELPYVSPAMLKRGVHVQVMPPGALFIHAVDISRSGEDLVIDVPRYRERDEWELPIAPEAYDRLLEHIVSVREEARVIEDMSTKARLRYYKPSISPTDIEMAVGVILDSARVDSVATAYIVGLRVAAALHAATLELALTDEGARVLREARPDPAIPVDAYLRMSSSELTRRQAMFDLVLSQEPERVRGTFEDGLVTIELARAEDSKYHIQILSILARAGKINTIRPVGVEQIPSWCRKSGAPVDSFEWNAVS